LKLWLRLRVVLFVTVENSETVESVSDIRVIWSQRLLPDVQRALKQRLSLCIVADSIKKGPEIVERNSEIRRARTHGLLPDGQSTLIERLCLCVLASLEVEFSQIF